MKYLLLEDFVYKASYTSVIHYLCQQDYDLKLSGDCLPELEHTEI